MAKKEKITIPEAAPISESETELIAYFNDRFKAEIAQANTDDLFLLRFIRGYVNEEDQKATTEKILGDYFTWSEEIGLKKLAATKSEDRVKFCSRIWPNGIHGVSKDGHPILIDRPGSVNIKTLGNVPAEEYKNYHLQTMEHLETVKRRIGKKTGKQVYKHVAIMDLEGFTMSHFGEKFRGPMKNIADLDQTKYPESLSAFYIVNSTFLFKAVWSIASMWIDDITKSRIKFVKVPELLKYIDADQLPEYLGGTCKYTEENPCFSDAFVSGPKRELTPEEVKMLEEFKKKSPEEYKEPLTESFDECFSNLFEQRQQDLEAWEAKMKGETATSVAPEEPTPVTPTQVEDVAPEAEAVETPAQLEQPAPQA